MSKVEKDLFGLLAIRELSTEEREKIAAAIERYLLEKGGIVIAASCQDGILLVGVNPDCEQNLFQAFYRIALLGVGKFKDYKEIHNKIQVSAFRTGLRHSKADVDINEIIKNITEELEEKLNFETKRPPYKASFIITELGFKVEEDILEIVDFEGLRTKAKYAITLETPMVLAAVEEVMKPIKDEKGKVKFEKVSEMRPVFEYPVGNVLGNLVKKVCADDYIWTIREAALFIGLIIRSLDSRGGKFQMAFLDRGILQKTKTEERRFHHVWNLVTNPKSFNPLEPWQNWKKFVAPVYNKVKKGELFPEQKNLIELFELIEEGKLDKKGKKLLKKIGKEHLANLIVGLFKARQENNKKSHT